jgi:hypothetical protein
MQRQRAIRAFGDAPDEQQLVPLGSTREVQRQFLFDDRVGTSFVLDRVRHVARAA